MTAANLLGGLLFSAIGSVAFAYGRKQARLKTALFGVALIFYPWFVDDTVILYVIGSILTILMFIFKD